jgi:hypothetical protein
MINIIRIGLNPALTSLGVLSCQVMDWAAGQVRTWLETIRFVSLMIDDSEKPSLFGDLERVTTPVHVVTRSDSFAIASSPNNYQSISLRRSFIRSD